MLNRYGAKRSQVQQPAVPTCWKAPEQNTHIYMHTHTHQASLECPIPKM